MTQRLMHSDSAQSDFPKDRRDLRIAEFCSPPRSTEAWLYEGVIDVSATFRWPDSWSARLFVASREIRPRLLTIAVVK